MERFAQDAFAVGADGTIVTDLTPEEAVAWKGVSDAAGLDTIFLLSPTSTAARMALVGKMASGFLYCVSRTGITGASVGVPAHLAELVGAIRGHVSADMPICVGFGISGPDQARAICGFADGIVVGSALVDLLHNERDNPHMLQIASDFVATLKEATRHA
jgi:tryptophan synthase alpha chain